MICPFLSSPASRVVIASWRSTSKGWFSVSMARTSCFSRKAMNFLWMRSSPSRRALTSSEAAMAFSARSKSSMRESMSPKIRSPAVACSSSFSLAVRLRKFSNSAIMRRFLSLRSSMRDCASESCSSIFSASFAEVSVVGCSTDSSICSAAFSFSTLVEGFSMSF